MALIKRKTVLTSGRRWTFRLIVGLMSAVALSLLVIAPVTVLGDNWSMVGLSIVIAEILVLLGGMAWLAILMTTDEP